MPLPVRNTRRRRRKTPNRKLPVRSVEASSAEMMVPTRMKLRERRRDDASGGQLEEEERSQECGSRRSSRRKSTRNTTSAVAATSSSPPSSSASASARAALASEEASPDSKCPICLDRFNNLAYLDRCLHRFCFPCIQEWSHNKAECPLCKQPFASILHSVRAEDDFKEYTLRPAPTNSSVAATVAMVAAMASAARSDHQMRLMLRRHRVTDGGETTTRRRRRERGGGRSAGERTGVWEWYLDSPHLPLPPVPHHLPVSPIMTEESEEGEDLGEQRMRVGANVAERGVIFEGLTGLEGAGAPVAPNDRASRQLMTRLEARKRLQREGGTLRRLRERETVAFRRGLYRSSIRVHGVAGVNGNQLQSEITAESFRRYPAQLNRLRPWLRRELTVLYGAHTSLVDIVQRIIMARLARHGLQDTPTIEEELRPFLLARTDHFLHELVSYARSPLSLDNYDLQAVYEPPTSTMDLDGMSSSSDSSSVIAISEGEEGQERGARGKSEERPQGQVGGAYDNAIQTGSSLSLSAWDDETPGPSFSTAEPSCSLVSLPFSPALRDAANEAGDKEVEEECLIVGYKKPIAERTPELVQLSSDTEEEEEKTKEEETTAEEALPLPPSLPTIPPSTSEAFREEQQEARLQEKESSGRSWESVCTLSPPPLPAENERLWEGNRKQPSSDAVKEKRRRRRRGWEQSHDRLRKSGTFYNPNRSIYPAMMRQRSHSPSPFHSSSESCSPLPPSQPESSWEYCSSQDSPLTSSVSSSSSPLWSSPQRPSTLPQSPHSLSPAQRNTEHGEKPGGKRKYKSRHLDSDRDPSWRPNVGRQRERRRRRRERPRKEARRDSCCYSGESTRRRRDDRSPSVEIIYDGTITSDTTQPPARKRRRGRQRKTQHSSSPVIITLDSDSSHDTNSSGSSSPLSSQQTVDFSDLPPLPLVHSTRGGGALEADFCELPVDILDRGSDGSDETEPAGQCKPAKAIPNDNSDHEVDVENVGDNGSLLDDDDDNDNDKNDKEPPLSTCGPIRKRDTKTAATPTEAVTVDTGVPLSGGNNISSKIALGDGGHPNRILKRDSMVLASDTRLLATILNDLEGISPPKCHLSSHVEPNCLSDVTKRSVSQCEVSRADPNHHDWLAETRLSNSRQPDLPEEQQCDDLPPCHASFPPPPLLQRLKDGRDVPPQLKQASPVQTYNRNTPPPLKHKDAGSPRLSPVSPADPHSLHTHTDLHLNLATSDHQVIPPNSTLKKHLTSSLRRELNCGSIPATSCHLATDNALQTAASEVGVSTFDLHSIGSRSTSACPENTSSADRSAHIDYDYLPFLQSRSGCSGTQETPSSALRPPPVVFHPAKTSVSNETPAYTDSTSNSCRRALVHLECFSIVSAEGSLTGSEVVTTPSVFAPPSPVHSRSSGDAATLLRVCAAVDSSSASSGLMDIKDSSIINHDDQSPPTNLHSSTFISRRTSGSGTALRTQKQLSCKSKLKVEFSSKRPTGDCKPHNPPQINHDPSSCPSAAADRRKHSQAPVDEHSASSVWTTHTRTAASDTHMS